MVILSLSSPLYWKPSENRYVQTLDLWVRHCECFYILLFVRITNPPWPTQQLVLWYACYQKRCHIEWMGIQRAEDCQPPTPDRWISKWMIVKVEDGNHFLENHLTTARFKHWPESLLDVEDDPKWDSFYVWIFVQCESLERKESSKRT